MHYVEAKGILSAKGVTGENGMNLYRGCTHGCIYCDSRSKCYHIEHDFEDIEVKSNALELLEDRLKRKRKRCMIGTGSMTDPYIPLEKDLQYVRKTLELIYKYGYGFSLITKSDLILRDLDLLKKINEKTKCVVQMTLTIADDKLSKIIEPNVITTRGRFEVLKKLRDEGIPAVVWLCPVLPFLTDTEENIREILRMCIEAEVRGIVCFGMGMTLREGNREYFYQKLDQHFPGMKEKYIQTFGMAYQLSSPNSESLMELFRQTCQDAGILYDPKEVFEYLGTFEEKNKAVQMSLFDLMQ